MTLRLTTLEASTGTVIKVDGRLERETLQPLAAACGRQHDGLALDLAELLWADREGVDLLCRLRKSGVQLLNARPFLKLLID